MADTRKNIDRWRVEYNAKGTGRQEQRVGGSEALSFGYDASGRLVNVAGDSSGSFSYDANGNRLNNGAFYDDQDRLLTAGSYSYFYSSRGSLTEKRANNGGGSTFYAYSTEGELQSVTLADGKIVQYESDGLGRRISRSYNGVTTGFLYKDQLEPIADVNGDGSIRSVYVYGEKAHVPSYMIRGGEKFAFVSDERGSVRMVIAMGSGSVVQELRYDVWGRMVFDSNPGFQPFGYAGGIYDEATGLVRFGARDYDGEIGRWLSKDPILFDGGDTNLVSYVTNDPVNWSDVSGLDRRICSRRLKNTPGMLGPIRHDFVEFRDSMGNITIKSFGPNGAIRENPNSSENSCPAYSKSSDQADMLAQKLADNLTDLVDYNIFGFNCQDYSRSVFNFQSGR
jgi:RHS repeat-associated protein